RGDVDGRRHIVDYRVEELLNALVLERGPTGDRNERVRDRRGTDGLTELRLADVFALEVLLHQRVVVFDGGLDEIGPQLLDLVDELGPDRPLLPVLSERRVVVDQLL